MKRWEFVILVVVGLFGQAISMLIMRGVDKIQDELQPPRTGRNASPVIQANPMAPVASPLESSPQSPIPVSINRSNSVAASSWAQNPLERRA